MSEGWVSIHRKLQDNPLWKSEPFTRGQAWIDLILLANHERGYIYVRDHKIEVKRGQVGWSQNRLASRWQWSRTKVRKFLRDLEKEQQIIQEKSHSYTVITLINYDDYQQEKQQKDNRSTTERQQEDTNNNVNNDNKKEDTPVSNNIPSLQEVREYFKKNGYDPSVAERAYNIYNASVEGTQRKYWRDSRDNIIKNWKLKMQSVWFKEENKINQNGSPFRTDSIHL